MASSQEMRLDWHQTKQPTIYGVASMFLFVATIAVVLRVWASLRQFNKVFADDVFMILALVLSYLVAVIYIWVAVNYGFGLHFYRVLAEHPTTDIISIFRGFWATSVVVAPWIYCIKVSLLIYYRRIFNIHQTWFLWAWWGNMIFATCWVVGATVYYILQCMPPQYYWEKIWLVLHAKPPYSIRGRCAGGSGVHDEIVSSVPLMLSLLSDLGILGLPMAAVSGLRLSFKRKFGVTIIFAVGSFACVFEILRIWSDATADKALSDPTWGTVTFVCLNMAEGNTAILAGCMPHMVSQYRYWRSKAPSIMFGASRIRSMGNSFKRFFSRGKTSTGKRSATSNNRQNSSTKAPQVDLTGIEPAHIASPTRRADPTSYNLELTTWSSLAESD